MSEGADLVPPHALDAELAVIGACLIDRDLVDVVAAIVRPAHFYAHVHETIFACILALARTGAPVGKIAVAEALRARSALERCGGASYLSTAMDTVQTTASAGYFARLVREKAQLRALSDAGRRIERLGYDGEDDADDALAMATALLQTVADDATEPRLHTASASLDAYNKKMTSNIATYYTPWAKLDRMTRGFTGDELVVWASDPGVGKSFLLSMLAAFVAEQYGPVAFFATEMGEFKSAQRLIALYSGISAGRQRTGFEGRRNPHDPNARPFSELELDNIAAAQKRIAALPLFLSDETMATEDVIAQCRRLHRQQPLKAVFIDTLGALSELAMANGRGPDKSAHDRQKRSTWNLKRLAKELDIPVHVAHHFSRADPRAGTARPSKERLRDGGGLENTATTIILPHREIIVEKDPETKRSIRRVEYSWIIDKARDGNEGVLPMNFVGQLARWYEMGQDRLWLDPADPVQDDLLEHYN